MLFKLKMNINFYLLISIAYINNLFYIIPIWLRNILKAFLASDLDNLFTVIFVINIYNILAYFLS